MQKYRIAAVLLGGLFVAPLTATAQSPQLAYATGEPRSEYMVFLERDGGRVPAAAVPSLNAAANAAKAGKTIHVMGRAQHAEVVKQELIREGAPASAIIVAREPTKPLPKVDPIGDPANRKVDIKF